MNYTIEVYNWNKTGKNNRIMSSNTPSWPIPNDMSLRKSLFVILPVLWLLKTMSIKEERCGLQFCSLWYVYVTGIASSQLNYLRNLGFEEFEHVLESTTGVPKE